MRSGAIVIALAAVLAAQGPPRAQAQDVPVAGFLPMVGLGLTQEFDTLDDELTFSVADPSAAPGAPLIGAGGAAHHDLALVDTGANGSLLTSAANAAFDLSGAGLQGTKTVTVGGATGFFDAQVSNPMGLYAAGLQQRAGAAPLSFQASEMVGQTSVSVLTLPPDSELPNVLGLPFTSQYSTYIRSDQPQLFEVDGQTVRSPSVEFHELGSGGQGIARRAPISLQPGISFANPPAYIPDFVQIINGGEPHLNPTSHTLLSDGVASVGGMFVSVDVGNQGAGLQDRSFFLDTGADVTVVSELNAARLGFDVVLDEPEFTVAVVGSGGQKLEVPGFFVDEFTVETVGGALTANNVPVIVLNVTNAADPGNVVDGIVGTNLFARRNIVIDPDPSLGGGNLGPQLYISDPVTTDYAWATGDASAQWSAGGSWSEGAAPDLLGVARLKPAGGGDQEAVIEGDARAWEVQLSGGAGGESMTLRLAQGAKLTTFAGVALREGGELALDGATLDTHYVEIRGGRLAGSGVIRTGSGSIAGQVENVTGVVAPGDGVGVLEIEGRFAMGVDGALEMQLGGLTPGDGHDQLVIDGQASLGGALEVALVDLGDGFTPSAGDTFTLAEYESVVGDFDSLSLPAGYAWRLDAKPTSLVLETLGEVLQGDFNGDGVVDAGDYSVWRDGLGTAYTAGDYAVWRENYGAVAGARAASVTAPEPGALALLVAATTATLMRRRAGARRITVAHG